MRWVWLVLASCLPGPDVGPPLALADASTQVGDASTSCNADSDPAHAVSYSLDLVDGVFVRGKCLSCHTGGGEGAQQSGFVMSSYQTLRAGGRHSGTNIVIDGAPCSSILVEKLGSAPPFGKQMPYNGPPYLNAADVQLVHDWISEGARDQ